MDEPSLVPPSVVSALLEQRYQQLVRGVPLDALVGVVTPAEHSALEQWWKDCTDTPLTVLFGMTLQRADG